MEGRVYMVYTTDSHGRTFADFPVPNQDRYQTIPIVKRGYKLHQLEREVCNLVKYICACSPCLMIRIRNEGGRELTINRDNQVIHRLNQFRAAL